MKTVSRIIEARGGLDWLRKDSNYIKIVNRGWMPLVIEHIGVSGRGHDLISVAHYGEQGGDPMRDPEMCFEVFSLAQGRAGVKDGSPVTGLDKWVPYYFRNDYAGIEQEAIVGNEINGPLVAELIEFSEMWDRNIKEQGFEEKAAEVAV